MPAASNGCARCTRSSRPSGRRPKSPRSCLSRSPGSRGQHRPTATASLRRARSRCATSTITWRARKGQGGARSGAAPRDHPQRREEPRVCAGLRAGRGREPAERSRRAGRMAGRADGHVRRVVPENPRRGDPRHHPQQPEMLRGARSEDRPARQPLHPHRQHRGRRRRQGDHRRQRARDPRAACPTRSSSTRPI